MPLSVRRKTTTTTTTKTTTLIAKLTTTSGKIRKTLKLDVRTTAKRDGSRIRLIPRVRAATLIARKQVNLCNRSDRLAR